MQRRQFVSLAPSIAALAILPSAAQAIEAIELPLPPTLVMEPIRKDMEPGLMRLDAYWEPYGSGLYLLTSYNVRLRPLWWPKELPYWGHATEAEFIEEFKEGIAHNYQESRLFYEKYGVAWIGENMSFRPEPEYTEQGSLKAWHKIKGTWKLCAHGFSEYRQQYTEEEMALQQESRRAWLQSGKTLLDAHPGWS